MSAEEIDGRRATVRAPQEGSGIEAIHEALQRSIDTRPDHIAVRDGSTSLTYHELSRRADLYAGQLYRLGVRPGGFVPVRLPKSPDLVAVLLGILRLGAAYSLIGFDWPPARVRSVLDRLDPVILVGERGESDANRLRTWWPTDATELHAYPKAAGSARDPYAVFFTSGTTGDPKGVICPHVGITRLLAAGSASDFYVASAAAQSLALPWDFSALEIWATLLSGATLILVQDRYLTGPKLRELVARECLDTVLLATSVFAAMVEEDPEAFAGLTKVIVGGEALSARHCQPLLARFPVLQLVNAYGPVEAGVFSTTHRVTPADCRRGRVPIGTALPDTYLRIEAVDREEGAGGELLVGGPGIAHGYLADPELTSTRFVERTVDHKSVTMYRTGDLVRSDAQGRLYYEGRIDHQVKVSGLRVEPAEVEAMVCSIPGVRDCVAVVHQPESGRDRYLVAFYVSDAGVEVSTVARELGRRAAPFQIPRRIVELDRIPLSSHGKVDRSALLELAGRARSSTPDRVLEPLVTPAFEEVRAVVAEVLGLPRESLADELPLAALGATSLDLGRIAVRLGRTLGTSIPLSALFEHRSIRALTSWLAAAGSDRTDDHRQSRQRSDLLPTQAYFLSDHLDNPESTDQNCIFGWQVAGRLDLDTLGRTFDQLHQRHEALRSRYDFRRGSRITPQLMPPPPLVSEQVQTSAEAIVALRRLGQRRFRPRDGNVWFPFAITIAEPAPTMVFGLCAHHVAIDGGSAPTLADDIADSYHQLSRGLEPSLAPAASVATATRTRRESLDRVDLERQRKFWTAELADLQPLVLPPGDPAASEPVVTHHLDLTPAETARLEQLARDLRLTTFAVYLSAYAEALRALTQVDDLAVLTAVDQRADHRLRRCVNCLISFLCLRLRRPTNATASASASASAIRATAEAIRAPFSAQDVLFLEGLPPGSAFGQGNCFRNMFILQDNFRSEIPLAGRVATTLVAPYPGLPLDLLTEVIPYRDGGAAVYVHARPTEVAPEFCPQLATTMHAVLRRYAYRSEAAGVGDSSPDLRSAECEGRAR